MALFGKGSLAALIARIAVTGPRGRDEILAEIIGEQRFVQLIRLRLVDSGQGRSAHGADTRVIELSGLSRAVADHIPKAVAT